MAEQYDLYGGLPPHEQAPTSHAAAVAILPHVNALQRRVYDYIRSRGEHGATDEEIKLALGLRGSTVRPRRCELHEKGLVVDTRRTRPTVTGRQATVWVAKVYQ